MANLGFVGLGAMGGRVTKRLLDAGHSVIGYNRTQSKARWLVDAGMRRGQSPRAVAESADIVFSMVTNTAALHQVCNGPDGILVGLSKGKVYIDMSTVSPAASRHLATQVLEKGAHMLDSPVSGSVLTLEQGNLSLMVGGDETIFEQVRPVLFDIGPKVNYVGKNGQAVLMKIAVNLNLQTQIVSFYEGLLLAIKGGVPIDTALEVMLNSVIASPALKYRSPFILNMPEEAWFNVNMMQKDMLLAEELGRELNVALPSVAYANQLLTAARAMGLAERDFAIVYKVLARMSGVDM
jgi:3-hydroxyisobutyrate dehydrogenase-like beta-hydroxyacid dehydrogenase